MKKWKKLWCILLVVLLCTVTFGNFSNVSHAAKGDLGEGYGVENINAEFTTVNGEKVSSQSEGIVTIVLFARTNGMCLNSSQVVKALCGSSWIHKEGVRLLVVDIDQSPVETVRAMQKENGNDAAVFCYDETYGAANTMFSYLRNTSGAASSVTLPVTVIVDGNNKVQYCRMGYITADAIYSYVANLAGWDDAEEDDNGKVDVYVEGTFDEEQAFQVLELVNQARAAQGKNPLKMDETLTEKAMQRAAECSVYYSHTRPNGESCFSILEGFYRMGCAENIAAGHPNADQVVAGWLNSSGHYANIMNEDFEGIGIGCFYQNGVRYWAQLFSVYTETEKTQEAGSVKKVTVKADSSYLGSLSLQYEKQKLQVGETASPALRLSNLVLGFSVPSMDNITFQTSDEAVAKVDEDGILQARSQGTAVITAVLDGVLKAEYAITVEEAEKHPKVSAKPSGKPSYPTNVPALSNPVIEENGSMPSGKLVTWDCVYFGSYPQSEVTPEDSAYKKLESAAGWDSNGDVTIDGVKYRRLRRGDATFVADANSESDYMRTYYLWEDGETYHYFRYEPIKWRVLSTDGGQAFLLSDQILDTRLYHTEFAMSITWETSTVRSWLNGYTAAQNDAGVDYSSENFITSAFDAGEQEAIVANVVKNDSNLYYGTDGGNDTTDKIFLLSESEAYTEEFGYAADADVQDWARRAQSSDYAKAMGVYDGFGGVGIWKLRTPGFQACHSAYVYYGDVYQQGCFNDSNNEKHGIRAAVRLDLAFPEQYQDAGTVNSYGIAVGPVIPSEEPGESIPPTASEEPEESTFPTASEDPGIKPEVPLKGDVNQDEVVNLEDAQMALKGALRIVELDEKQKQAADVDGVQGISLTDAQMILKAALKIIQL